MKIRKSSPKSIPHSFPCIHPSGGFKSDVRRKFNIKKFNGFFLLGFIPAPKSATALKIAIGYSFYLSPPLFCKVPAFLRKKRSSKQPPGPQKKLRVSQNGRVPNMARLHDAHGLVLLEMWNLGRFSVKFRLGGKLHDDGTVETNFGQPEKKQKNPFYPQFGDEGFFCLNFLLWLVVSSDSPKMGK